MELKELIALYRRWIWLLIFGLIVGLASGFVASKLQAPVYEASAKVLIVRNRQQVGADLLALSDQQLVSTYEQLLTTRPFLAEAESRLGFPLNPDQIGAEILPDSQIIQITVQDTNAARVASIANTLVQILIEQNETLQAGRYGTYEEGLASQISQVQEQIDALQSQITLINEASIQDQLAQVNKQITDLQGNLSELEKDIAGFPSNPTPVERAALTEKQAQAQQLRSLLYLYQQIQTNLTFIGEPVQGSAGREDSQITSLRSTLNLYQDLYLTLLTSLESAKLARVQSTPTVTLIEPATVPQYPVKPNLALNTALSGMLGVFLAAGVILLVDYFSDTFKTAKKVEEILHAAVIGEILETNGKTKLGRRSDRADREKSEQLNAFGSLQLNLSRLMEGGPQKTILITSATRGEGKTTVAVNLADAFVKSGRKATLIDADLQHPQVHKRLGLQNETGLTDILSGNLDWRGAAIQQGSLILLTSGASTSSLYGLLDSNEANALLEKLQKKSDMVIIDGPPWFVRDAQVLASKVGGVLLVIRQGETTLNAARSVMDQLERMHANVLGVVLNGVSRGDAYYHYDDYYRTDGREKPRAQVEKPEEGGRIKTDRVGEQPAAQGREDGEEQRSKRRKRTMKGGEAEKQEEGEKIETGQS